MPALGADMEQGRVVEWLVKPGDYVHRGDMVAVVDTEKADIDVESFEEGVVAELLVEVGTIVPVGAPLARITQTPAAGAPAAGAPVPPPPPPAAPGSTAPSPGPTWSRPRPHGRLPTARLPDPRLPNTRPPRKQRRRPPAGCVPPRVLGASPRFSASI